MRILWLNHRDPKHPEAGGAEVHLREVGRRLVQRGCDVSLVSERFDGSPSHEVIDGIRITRIGNKFSVHMLAPLLVSKMSRECDVIVDDIANAVPWWSGLVTKKPVVGIVHHVHQSMASLELDFPLDMGVKLAERTVKFAYSRLIAVSEATKRQAEARLGLNGSLVDVVYSGVDHSLYRPCKDRFEDPTLLWVGRIKKYKNIEHLLIAFYLAKRQVPNLRLIIAGKGDHQKEIVNFAHTLGLKDISFVGAIDDREKAKLFAKSWALCLTSVVEGWGLVITEAAACGTPALAYDTGASGEALVHNKTGFLVNNGDIEALARKIKLIVSDSLLRDSLGRGALEYSHNFDWEKTTDETMKILSDASYQ